MLLHSRPILDLMTVLLDTSASASIVMSIFELKFIQENDLILNAIQLFI